MNRNKQQQNKSSRVAASSAAAAAIAAAVAAAFASTARADVRLNEVFIDAPGTNNTQDFIELRSTAGGAESFNYHMILLEGDGGAAAGTGSIDQIIPLS